MFELIQLYFLTEPSRLLVLGRGLFKAGAVLILVGLFGNIVTSAPATLLNMTGQVAASRTLAQVYPSLPVWWIPETVVGYFFASMLMAAGLYFVLVGKRLRKFLGA